MANRLRTEVTSFEETRRTLRQIDLLLSRLQLGGAAASSHE